MLMTTKLTIAKMDENDELCEDEKWCKHDFEILVFNFFFFQRVGVDFRWFGHRDDEVRCFLVLETTSCCLVTTTISFSIVYMLYFKLMSLHFKWLLGYNYNVPWHITWHTFCSKARQVRTKYITPFLWIDVNNKLQIWDNLLAVYNL